MTTRAIDFARRYAAQILAAISLAMLFASCHKRATRNECQTIFDRIVELELGEIGYRDPALAARKRRHLTWRHRATIAECIGRRLPPNALRCIQKAKSTEELSHQCLR